MNKDKQLWELDMTWHPFRIFNDCDETYKEYMNLFNFFGTTLAKENAAFNVIDNYKTWCPYTNVEFMSLEELKLFANEKYIRFEELKEIGIKELKEKVENFEPPVFENNDSNIRNLESKNEFNELIKTNLSVK